MAVDLEPMETICSEHETGDASLVMLLQDIQSRYGYIPKEAIKEAASRLDVPVSRLYGLATFYRSFSLTPRGRHEVCLCTGTACHVRGAAVILGHLKRSLGIREGQTTADGEVSLETVNCVGACALGPVMVCDGIYHGKVTVAKVDDILSEMKSAEPEVKV